MSQNQTHSKEVCLGHGKCHALFRSSHGMEPTRIGPKTVSGGHSAVLDQLNPNSCASAFSMSHLNVSGGFTVTASRIWGRSTQGSTIIEFQMHHRSCRPSRGLDRRRINASSSQSGTPYRITCARARTGFKFGQRRHTGLDFCEVADAAQRRSRLGITLVGQLSYLRLHLQFLGTLLGYFSRLPRLRRKKGMCRFFGDCHFWVRSLSLVIYASPSEVC